MSATGSPSIGLLMLEAQRALLEGLTLPPTAALLSRAPRGEGQTVLVIF